MAGSSSMYVVREEEGTIYDMLRTANETKRSFDYALRGISQHGTTTYRRIHDSP
jgi:hypothetical protein